MNSTASKGLALIAGSIIFASLLAACGKNLLGSATTAPEQVPQPTYSINTGKAWFPLSKNTQVYMSLTCDSPEASIFYSINNSPAQSYTGPSPIPRPTNNSTTAFDITSYATRPKYSQSSTLSKTFRYLASNTVVRIAGRGPTGGSVGDGWDAIYAYLDGPQGACSLANGDCYVADTGNNRICKVTGETFRVCVFTGLTTPLNNPQGVCVDTAGNVYIADTGNARVVKVAASTAASVITTSWAVLPISPVDVCVSGSYLFISDQGDAGTNPRVWRCSLDGSSPSAYPSSTGTGPDTFAGMCPDGAGGIYVADPTGNRVWQLPSGATGFTQITVTVTGASPSALSAPQGVAYNTNTSTLYIADTGNNRIVALASGTATVCAGTGTVGAADDFTAAPSATFSGPTRLAYDPVYGILITDAGNNTLRELVY